MSAVCRALRVAGLLPPAGRFLGHCRGCGTSVRSSDAWRRYGTGVCHLECVEYVRRAS